MKIAFTGASGTGKTTLAKWLAEDLGIPFNPVGSRSTAGEMGFMNPYDVDKAHLGQYTHYLAEIDTSDNLTARRKAAEVAMSEWAWADRQGEATVRELFQKRLQLAKIEWEDAHEDFVSDRSTVDDFVYCALHNVGAIDEEYLERARAHLAKYDLVFFTPIDAFLNIDGDPNRVADKAYHEVFELLADGALINWLGNDWNERVVVLHDAGLTDRQEYCLHRIGMLP